MNDSTGETPADVPVAGSAPDPAAEDERRQKAAAANRKKAEEQWLRNKERWIEENFPGKRRPS